jgi:ankyrin repeat protein
MKTLEEQCIEICKYTYADSFRRSSRAEALDIAQNLAKLLLDADAVNIQWRFDTPYMGIEGIVSFLQYMDDDLIGQLLAKGLDLNQETHNGVLPFTWFIGNAEHTLVDRLLTSAEQNQTLEQRLVWINKIDAMTRTETIEDKTVDSCSGLFSLGNLCIKNQVGQTPLQLAIAKGYTHTSGTNHVLEVSDLQLAEKLLRLGADKEVNYQEPTRGNTALHIAYARRDFDAIQLLESYGASQGIRNKDGETPADMLSLSFSQVKKLLAFHTSPDQHPNTFRLNEAEFHDQANLNKIQNGVKIERQLIKVNGKNISLPNNPMMFNRIESAAIEDRYDVVSSLVYDGADPKRAMGSIQHRINLLNFMIEDGLLYLENIPWRDYLAKRQEIDETYHGSSNPYMYDIDKTGYEEFQRYASENKEDVMRTTKKNASEYPSLIIQFNKALKLLEKTALQKAAMQDDKATVEQLLGEGVETPLVTKALEVMLAALHFKQTLKPLSLALFKQEITWDTCCAKIDLAYEKAGGASNYYLPNRKYQLDEASYNEGKLEALEALDELIKFIEEDTAELDDQVLKCEAALQLIGKPHAFSASEQRKFKEEVARISSSEDKRDDVLSRPDASPKN